MDQSCFMPHTPTIKLRSSSVPLGVCDTSGWNCTPNMGAAPSAPAHAANSQLGVEPTGAKPGGSAVILSPWLIHTLKDAGSPASSGEGAAPTAVTSAWPNSRSGARSTDPPSACDISWKP